VEKSTPIAASSGTLDFISEKSSIIFTLAVDRFLSSFDRRWAVGAQQKDIKMLCSSYIGTP
jgi:hypothetical protein